MTFKFTGEVGINETSPTEKLHISWWKYSLNQPQLVRLVI